MKRDGNLDRSSGKTKRELALEWQSTSKEHSGRKFRDAFNHRANFFLASSPGNDGICGFPFFFFCFWKRDKERFFSDKGKFRVTIAFVRDISTERFDL